MENYVEPHTVCYTRFDSFVWITSFTRLSSFNILVNPLTPSSKGSFSQPYKERGISVAVRISSISIFHLSKLWKSNFFILCDVIFLVWQAAGEIWNWSLLGCGYLGRYKELTVFTRISAAALIKFSAIRRRLFEGGAYLKSNWFFTNKWKKDRIM